MDIVRALLDKGVRIPHPASVFIAGDVDPSRISGDGVTIHPGCRITGPETLVMEGAELGRETPLTVENCQVGPNVSLKGGYVSRSVFLAHSSMGSGAHVREACILEEHASCAHSVGLKHTILFPFVTLGSLVNFCDCLMAGGTGRKDHSEVGSSYIHFNFTPRQDKATASLIGDVPHGVMLDRKPIFLGGQGGLVGPSSISYGTTIAAGVVFKGRLEEECVFVGRGEGGPALKTGATGGVKDKVVLNVTYIANLVALRAWYAHVRTLFAPAGTMARWLTAGAVDKLELAMDERISRLEGFVDKLRETGVTRGRATGGTSRGDPALPGELVSNKDRLTDRIMSMRSYEGDPRLRDAFLDTLRRAGGVSGRDYLETIKGLGGEARSMGTAWLSEVVTKVVSAVLEVIPAFRAG
ncbi:MAG TPA: hypothetical protein PLS81_08725 [Deltaproteobacteria bacterium]|nr:hypothetical protein [Deltaproteobacteria bacterium]HPP80309.1 hypothetical protein [Deltaproteobacteria bacterium]